MLKHFFQSISSHHKLTEDSLTIHIRATKNPEYYQVSLEMPGRTLFGGPNGHPPEMITSARIAPLRETYAVYVDDLHAYEQASVPFPPPSPDDIIALGQEIAKLLPASARHNIASAVLYAQQKLRHLQIVIEVTPETRQFLAVPWELLVLPLHSERSFDAPGAELLLQYPQVSLTRRLRGAGQRTVAQLALPLNVQAFVATPYGGEPIEYESSYAALRQVLSADIAAACFYTGVATLQAIHDRLRQHKPQIVHLICHGEESPTATGTRYDFIFTHPDGGIQRVSAFDLAPIFAPTADTQLVILQACFSGTITKPVSLSQECLVSAEQRAIEHLALTLVRQGVPAVVAMQGRVSQEAVGLFVQAFYEELAKGQSLNQAVAAGRMAMRCLPGLLDWTIPVVYQGSGPTEMATWYTGIADSCELVLSDPQTKQNMRGFVLLWVLILMVGGLIRWIMLPPQAPANPELLVRPLATWIAVGLIGPALIVLAQRGPRERHELSIQVRHAAYRAQWSGAYLGFALSGLCGLALWLSGWALGIFRIFPDMLAILGFALILLVALSWSYVTARSQWRSALAIAPVNPELYDSRTIGLIFVAALIMICIPFLIFGLPDSPLGFLLYQPFAALALAATLTAFVFALDRESRAEPSNSDN